MKPTYFISLLCGCATLLPASLSAQEENLSRKDSIKGFNALDYTLQRRTIPEGRPVSNADPGKNFSISLMGGVGDVAESGQPWMYTGAFAISKQVSTFNTYRLLFSGAYRKDHGKKLLRAGAELSHLFNISDYLAGYRQGAHYNLYTVIGAGAYATKRTGEQKKLAVGVHGGLQFDYHLMQNWDWFVEPKVYLYSDNIDLIADNRKFNVGWSVLTGFTYRFTKWPVKSLSTSFPDNLFLEGAIGLQGDYTSRVRNIAGKTPGPIASASIGKWFYPIGVRATLFGGYHNTVNNALKVHKEAYAGGRLEGMLNLNTLLKPSEADPRFEVNLAGGYEFGILAHKGAEYNGKKKAFFRGFTAAMQGVYFVDRNVGITAELRYSPVNKMDVVAEQPAMRNLSFMMGLQYRRRDEVFKEHARKYHFQPYNFAYALGSLHWPVHGKLELATTKKNLGMGVGIGRWFSPFSGVRAGLEVQRHTNKYYPLHLSADYLLNLTNVINNYMPERIFDLNAFAGVVFTHNTYRSGRHFGVQGGLQQVFHLNDTWGIVLEESARLYKGSTYPDARPFTSHQFNAVLDGRLGLVYNF